jgi:antitoxin CptB
MPTFETTEEKKKRLQWQCRRGMLENDLPLRRYLSTSYLDADPTEQDIFESFLAENDQQMFLWLSGREEAPGHYKDLVEKLRR